MARDIGEQPELDEQSDSILIASCKVSGKDWLSSLSGSALGFLFGKAYNVLFHYCSESSFQALVAFGSRLVSMSVTLRLNLPAATTPSPVATTPVSNSRAESQEKEQQPDMFCVMAHMSSVKCSSGCANLNEQLLVCGEYYLMPQN